MADPTTVNQVAAKIADILEIIIEGRGEDVAIALILADTATVVAIPVVGVIWTALVTLLVGKFGTYFYRQAALAATDIIIDFQTDGEVSNANNGFENLQMAIASGDQSAIDQASADMDKYYAALIHSDGGFSP